MTIQQVKSTRQFWDCSADHQMGRVAEQTNIAICTVSLFPQFQRRSSNGKSGWTNEHSNSYSLHLPLFRYPFHPRVTTVARKRSRSFCQKCRWQVIAKHAYTLRILTYVALHEVTWAWLYGVHRTCAETAAVSCGTSHASAVSTPLRWIFFKKRAIKSQSLMLNHTRAQWVCSRDGE